jgi:hypothetical protein
MKLNKALIEEHSNLLKNHSLLVTNNIQSKEDLKVFMEHHIFAVWDFMSLLKTLQHEVVPSGNLWIPTRGTRSDIARLINDIVLCEESDIAPGGGSVSHFDLYLQSMLEINADISTITTFLKNLNHTGSIPYHLAPKPAEKFMRNTFGTIKRGPHCVAASFAYGRETIIPDMFTRLLTQLNISKLEAPKFHYYLQRHIEVDGDEHGPMSERLVEYFCDDDPIKIHEAEQAAISAIQARIEFFNNIEHAL